MKTLHELLYEESGAADMAQASSVIGEPQCRGHKCFSLDDAHEFHSFQKGKKTFHRWAKHTKSEEIRQWAKSNPGRNFYVNHEGNYMLINRSKQRSITMESIDCSAEFKLITEAIDLKDKNSFFKGIKDVAKKVYNAYHDNDWERYYAFEDVLRRTLDMGAEYIDEITQKLIKKLEAKKWDKQDQVAEFAYYLMKA
jgi:hypothetical protein